MNKQEVWKLIGKDNWPAFQQWMKGQTVGLDDNGVVNYYEGDVQRFIQKSGLAHQKRKISMKEAKKLWNGDWYD